MLNFLRKLGRAQISGTCDKTKNILSQLYHLAPCMYNPSIIQDSLAHIYASRRLNIRKRGIEITARESQ